VFVVDYLEKAAASPRQLKLFATNIYAREADDVEQIKSFSEQHEVPVTLLAQLNKLGKGQSFDNLDRTAIRGAGEKTEKANVVILLHRDSLESQDVSVRIDKNTIGPTGTFKQYMDTPRFSVADVTEVAL
jgi:replicative DNA helicase